MGGRWQWLRRYFGIPGRTVPWTRWSTTWDPCHTHLRYWHRKPVPNQCKCTKYHTEKLDQRPERPIRKSQIKKAKKWVIGLRRWIKLIFCKVRYTFGSWVRWVLDYLNLDRWFGFRSFINVEVRWVRCHELMKCWISFKWAIKNSPKRSHFYSPWNLQFLRRI